METGFSLPARRTIAVDRAAAWRLALGALVCASIVARTWAAWLRATPNYFPDEYIYSALSRSVAAGHLPAVRGHAAHFPALLQPILTAPAWWFGSLETGYRLSQAILCVAVSTAALAVWWTARRLGLTHGTAFAAAAIALAVPDVGYSGWLLSEPVAYPLFIAAVGTGAVALAQPTRRAQCAFLGFALLATFARMQLAILFLAYLAAALVLRRLRAQRIVAGGIAIAVVVGAAGGLGYYRKAPSAFHLVSAASLGRNALVLAFAAGWIIVPAGLLGLAGAWRRPRTDVERAFGALALFASAGVLAEATLYGVGSLAHERYGFYLLPLVALGFALHADRGWPWRRAHAGLAAAMLLVASTVPMSAWATAGGNAHSLVLTGLLKLEALTGSAGAGSLCAAGAAGALSLVAVFCAWRRATALAATLAVALCIAASAFATSFDVQNSRNVKAAFLPDGPEWIHGPATLVAGPAPRTSVLEQLFWNRDLTLDVLPGAASPDVFAAAHIPLDRVRGPVILDESGGALVPVSPIRWNGPWLAAKDAQLAARLDGLVDGWLSPRGSGRVYRPGRLSLTITAPRKTTLTIAGRRSTVSPATPTHEHLCVGGRFGYAFSSHGYLGLRAVSARATFPRFTPNAAC